MQFLTPFLPGEKVEKSGQYWVIHLRHRLPYKAVLTEGERFPLCNQCTTSVLYEFASELHEGASLQADRDFTEEQPSVWQL